MYQIGTSELFKATIGNHRYLTANIYRGETFVHIREYVSGNGRTYPTEKGVSFTKARWANFLIHLNNIERSVELIKTHQPVEYYQHVGGKIYVTISKDFKYVNLRKYFLPKSGEKELPTRIGIALRLSEWDMLIEKIKELHKELPELSVAKPCFDKEDHQNQQGYLDCLECNPFGLDK